MNEEKRKWKYRYKGSTIEETYSNYLTLKEMKDILLGSSYELVPGQVGRPLLLLCPVQRG